MELGQYQLQIFVSLVVILVAAFVALICDFLKGSNEQLRELTIELRVRREEEQRTHLVTPRPAERGERAERAKPEQVAAPTAPALAAPNIAVPNMAVPNSAVPKRHSGIDREKKRTVNAEALAAMERGAALAGSGGRPRSVPVAEPKPELKPEQAAVRQEVAKPAAIKAIARKDWGALLSRGAAPEAQHTVPVVAPQTAEPTLPAGFQDGFVLNKLVQSHQPVSGLVVSIGVNASHKSDGTLPESVSELVQSLIGPNDFAAQSGEDEFLLIYPREQGASAQRRLSHIAQQLWDFQLRSLGSFQILFSWGGVEVHSESIDEAIASASERMQETKRGRKLLTMASPPAAEIQNGTPLRQAV